jgi:hypothetical protein
MGEPIKLMMEFTADREGHVVDILPDAKQPGQDTVVISPESGVSRWLDEMTAGNRYARDVFPHRIYSTAPQRVELILNDTLRFDTAGRYTVARRDAFSFHSSTRYIYLVRNGFFGRTGRSCAIVLCFLFSSGRFRLVLVRRRSTSTRPR